MRILIHALQSSGATFFAYFLSQNRRTLGVLDYWGHISERCPVKQPIPYIPCPEGLDIVCKVAVCTNYTFQDHKTSFKPDRTILFRRERSANYDKLNNKWYKNEGGTIDDKFAAAAMLRDGDYDHAINFEEFLTNRQGTVDQLNGLARIEDYNYPVTRDELFQFILQNSDWCRQNYEKLWGFGNLYFDPTGRPDPERLRQILAEIRRPG